MRARPEESAVGIREQAAAWASGLEGAGARKRAECLAWLKESPEHVKEFLFMTALWDGLGGIDAQRNMSVDSLLQEASAKVVSLSQGATVPALPSAHRARQRRWIAGLAAAVAAVAIAVAIGWSMQGFSDKQLYATAVGEQRTVKLSDGSMLDLNTRSRIEVRLDEESREFRLLEGEVMFSVAPDARRPFRVRTDGAVVQAIGTQFNVYRQSSDATVTVVEGAVRVVSHEHGSPGDVPEQTVKAGEQLRVTANGALQRHAQPDIEKAVAWRKRQLIFRGDPLATVAAEVNRYNENVQLRVDGQARERRLIGVFAADDPESLVQFLAQESDVVVEKRAAEIVIRARTD